MDTKTCPTKFMLYYLLFLCLHLKTHVSLAIDAITADQSLSGDETIVSSGGVFELGFFKPGKLPNYYIGMWYYKRVVTVKTIVWVANRKQPVSDRFTSVLRIIDSNLVLVDETKSLVWSTNVTSTTTSGSATSIQAVLLDNGNLVLRVGSNSSLLPLWQSFDHPAHTWLAESKIGFNNVTKQTQKLTSWKNSEDPAPGLYSLELDPNGSNSYILLWNSSRQYWTSGSWDEHNRIFSLIPEMRLNYIYNCSYVTNENESYFTYALYDPKKISQAVMHFSGQIQQLTWSETSKQWILFWSQPRKQCEVYGLCGAFSTCNATSLPSCSCLKGFEPKLQGDWNLNDHAGGCSRITGLQCGNATSHHGTQDQFLEMTRMTLSENDQYAEVGSIVECESICLNHCSCTAYSYESGGCLIWNGDLLHLQQLEASNTNGITMYIRLAASEFENPPKSSKGSEGHTDDKWSLVIAIISATGGFLAIIFGYFLWKKTLGKRREHRRKYNINPSNLGARDGNDDTELPLIGLKSILAATNNFSEANKLGEGGFGPVYKGIFPENQEVAIKRLSTKSGQGHQEFMNELKLIAKLQHRNLVRLLGCCDEEEEMILIYEYMPNRSLDKFLFDPSEQTKLDWDRRFRIIEGIAQGVLYIHKYSRLKIIHRDLKASNILLDGAMNPKVSDFGIAKIFELNQIEANTNRVVGTYGYMSPEYARYGHFSEKLDVFSFGVLLLEIVTGKKNGAFYRFEHSLTLAGWAWKLWKENRGMEVIDASVRETCRPHEALRCIHVGFLCVQEAPADRPTMSAVIHMLQSNEASSLPPSKEPAFSIHDMNSNVAESSSQTSTSACSKNALTISLPEAR
ncbi:hypothetical protein ABKV19_020381 [Rosa sericea]